MNLERQYIRQFINESQKRLRKFEEDNNFLYAYTTRSRAGDGGWLTASSIEELRDNWDEEEYGSFRSSGVLVMKPATSVDKAMVLSSEPNTGGDIIYPSIDAAINGPTGLIKLGWVEGATITQVSEDEIQELLQTKDLNKAKEILRKTFVDAQDFGYFKGLYEYVSGPMPKEDGMTPGKIAVPTELKVKRAVKDLDYYKRKVSTQIDFIDVDEVPKEFITPELCKIAVKSRYNALLHIPKEFITPELCKIAVESSGGALQYVPEKFRTPELCKIAVEDFGYALDDVPEKFITPELCKIAVESNGAALKYVPEKFITQKLCNIAFKNRTYAFTAIPDKFKTPEMCRSALAIDAEEYFKYVPDRLKTPELCKIAVKSWGYAIKYVPDKLKTPELCQLAMNKSDYAIRFVPDEIKKQLGVNTDDEEQQ